MRSKKTASEEIVFEIAKPLLKTLYGVFNVDKNQVDKPDAAIDVIKPNKKHGRLNLKRPFKVGIEITTVDPRTFLRYNNERERDQDKVEDEIFKSIETGKDIGSSIRYYKVPIPADYISSAIEGKSKKHVSYTDGGNYKEMILICFSELVRVKDRFFEDGLKKWTAYNLSNANFPFDVVIFVDVRDGVAVRIYEKKKQIFTTPAPYNYIDASVEKSESFILEGNCAEYMNENPLIAPKE